MYTLSDENKDCLKLAKYVQKVSYNNAMTICSSCTIYIIYTSYQILYEHFLCSTVSFAFGVLSNIACICNVNDVETPTPVSHTYVTRTIAHSYNI